MSKHVAIIGGGLAGLSAAVALAENGLRVTLIERRPFLGGRASSYPVVDEIDQYVDNCQHVLMQCCTNLIDFYRRLGAEAGIEFHKRLVFLDSSGRLDFLQGSFLPAPFHMLPSFLRFRALDWKQKRAIARALVHMLRHHDSAALDRLTMLQWLQANRQPETAVEGFWRPVLVSALNEDIETASARYGVQVFLEGMLKNRDGYRLGIPVLPLARLYTEPASRFLDSRASSVKLRATVAQIEIHAAQVHALFLADGTRVRADYYISSTPPDVLLRLLPAPVINEFEVFSRLSAFTTSPITAVYLWLDRQPEEPEYVATPRRTIQWIFNKRPAGQEPYLGLVVSASRDLLPMGRGQILEIALRDLHAALPSTQNARVLRSAVIKEPYATFSCRAGIDQLRPDQQTPLRNFYLAGDWTQTGWPATMEGAVRSGYRCAELILQQEGKFHPIVKPDLPATGLSRFFF